MVGREPLPQLGSFGLSGGPGREGARACCRIKPLPRDIQEGRSSPSSCASPPPALIRACRNAEGAHGEVFSELNAHHIAASRRWVLAA
jgi:hypothetical protein